MISLSISQLLIVCPLIFLGGFVDSVAGGGGMISLPAYMIAGLPVHNAIATNKLSSGAGTLLTTVRYMKSGYIPLKAAIASVICAMAGSACGAELALLINDRIFKWIMLFIIPLTAIYVMRGKGVSADREPFSEGKTILIAMAVALALGIYDGFYGPGTGTFLILLLASGAHMKIEKANGVAKVINLTTNLSSLVVYLINGKVFLLLGGIAAVFGLAGNYAGSTLFKKEGARAVKPIMIVVLVIFFVSTLTEML